MHGCRLGCIRYAPSGDPTALANKVAGNQARKSGCSRCDKRRHLHREWRHTSPAIVFYMAGVRLESINTPPVDETTFVSPPSGSETWLDVLAVAAVRGWEVPHLAPPVPGHRFSHGQDQVGKTHAHSQRL